MNTLNNISNISCNYYHFLFTHQNVKGVGVGYKVINGIKTNELCIHVLVRKKISETYLTCDNIIPKTFMGIKTDVIETGTPKAIASNINNPNKYRPLKGGCSVAPRNTNLRGTLGCIVVRKNVIRDNYFILSNNHVLADENKLPLGTEVIQPSLGDGGIPKTDVIAKLSDFTPIKFKKLLSKPKNFVDCALAELTHSSLISNQVLRIGTLTGYSTATLGSHVRKCGIRTGLTQGQITSINVTTEVEFSSKKVALFSNQIRTSLSSDSGDSGSVVVDDRNKVIGLLFTSSKTGALVNDINMVLKELKVEIYK